MVHHVLPDGSAYALRPIRPDDKARLATGLGRLSAESVYRRFLAPKPRLSAAELRYLTEVDGHDHAALVAVPAGVPVADAPVVAVGRWVRLRDRPDRAEIAVVVGDPLQGQGLGRRSARARRPAREHGIRSFSAVMLPTTCPRCACSPRSPTAWSPRWAAACASSSPSSGRPARRRCPRPRRLAGAMAAEWSLTIRHGPKVAKSSHPTLGAAVDALRGGLAAARDEQRRR
jgi:acetyltransferase